MAIKLKRDIYVKLINDEIKWLESNTKDCLEQNHIISVLNGSIDKYYPSEEQQSKQEWISVDEFNHNQNHGWCWIYHKGQAVKAFMDHHGAFRVHPNSQNYYSRESITHVQLITKPAPPEED